MLGEGCHERGRGGVGVFAAEQVAGAALGDDAGNIVPVSPEGIDALLEIWPVFEAFQTTYVAKGLILDAEKNVSAPLPTGPSAVATDTARPAKLPAPTAPQN